MGLYARLSGLTIRAENALLDKFRDNKNIPPRTIQQKSKGANGLRKNLDIYVFIWNYSVFILGFFVDGM